MVDIEKASHFWDWFELHQKEYRNILKESPAKRNVLLDKIEIEIKKYNEFLSIEFGGFKKSGASEIIVTAQGHKEHFKDVEMLVSEAPETIKNWKIFALKPPKENLLKTTFEGLEFDPDKIYFLPLMSEKDPTGVGIRVYYPNYNDENKWIYVEGTYLLLDNILGERSCADDIQHLEITQAPQNLNLTKLIKLSNVQMFIDNRKNRKTIADV